MPNKGLSDCSNLLFHCHDKYHDQKQLGRAKVYFSWYFPVTDHYWGTWGAETGTETMEEGFLLVCLLAHRQLAFLDIQDHVPTDGTANSKLVPHSSIINQTISDSHGLRTIWFRQTLKWDSLTWQEAVSRWQLKLE